MRVEVRQRSATQRSSKTHAMMVQTALQRRFDLKDGAEGCSATSASTEHRDGESEKADKHQAQQVRAARASSTMPL